MILFAVGRDSIKLKDNMYLFYNDNEGKETLKKEPVCRKQICLSESS